MKFLPALIAAGLVIAPAARAVYAPIPEQEQGRNLTFSVRGGLSYDSNIFGAATDAIGSAVWEVAPRVIYNASVTDTTFCSANYGLTLDAFDRRPGRKVLDSHDLTLRAAHAFNSATTLDLNDAFLVSRNPQSVLNGVPVNTDQSFTSNQLDGRFVTSVTPKIGTELKVRSIYYRYRNAVLGRSLDRIENLYGLAGTYAILPELKGVVELRHLDVFYRKQGELKNKHSEYAMTGFDYAVARKLTLNTRFGAEWRRRASLGRTTAPYVEVSGRYHYAERSFLTGGYEYTIDETSDPTRFTDERVNRFFVSVEHALSALIVASASVDYEPAVLHGRPGQADLNEDTTRMGGALTYTPRPNWAVSATCDFDHVRSDDPARSLDRRRIGVDATYTF